MATQSKTFQECYKEVEEEVNKFKKRWTLTSINWFDFDDVRQILYKHIYQKWDKWNQDRPLRPWLRVIIQNQIKNIVRDNYSIYSRPCLKCPHMTDQDGCSLYKKQGPKCEEFKNWYKKKSQGNNINLPIQYTNDDKRGIFDSILEMKSCDVDYDKAYKVILKESKPLLQEELFNIFQGQIISNNKKRMQSRDKEVLKANSKFLYKTVRNIIEDFELAQDIKINIQTNEQED